MESRLMCMTGVLVRLVVKLLTPLDVVKGVPEGELVIKAVVNADTNGRAAASLRVLSIRIKEHRGPTCVSCHM